MIRIILVIIIVFLILFAALTATTVAGVRRRNLFATVFHVDTRILKASIHHDNVLFIHFVLFEVLTDLHRLFDLLLLILVYAFDYELGQDKHRYA